MAAGVVQPWEVKENSSGEKDTEPAAGDPKHALDGAHLNVTVSVAAGANGSCTSSCTPWLPSGTSTGMAAPAGAKTPPCSATNTGISGAGDGLDDAEPSGTTRDEELDAVADAVADAVTDAVGEGVADDDADGEGAGVRDGVAEEGADVDGVPVVDAAGVVDGSGDTVADGVIDAVRVAEVDIVVDAVMDDDDVRDDDGVGDGDGVGDDDVVGDGDGGDDDEGDGDDDGDAEAVRLTGGAATGRGSGSTHVGSGVGLT